MDRKLANKARAEEFERIMNMSLEELEAELGDDDFFKDVFGDLTISKQIRDASNKSGIKLRDTIGDPLDDCLKFSNPDFNPANENTDNNCVNSAIAFCMRRLGMDVSAKPIPSEKIASGGWTNQEVSSAIKGMLPDHIKLTNVKSSSDIEKQITKQIFESCDEGHNVGMVTLLIEGIGCHDMAWEKMPNSDVIKLYDPARKNADMNKYYDLILSYQDRSRLNSIRLDDCAIDRDNLLKLFVKNA